MIFINGKFLTQNPTGTQRVAYELTTHMVRLNKTDICVLVPPQPIKQYYDVSDLPIKVIGRFKGVAWEQIDLPMFLLKRDKPFLVNMVNSAPIIYKNHIVIIHDATVFINPRWFSKAFASYYRFLFPILGKKSKKIITCSDSSKNDIVKYIGVLPENVIILQWGIAEVFTPDELPADELILNKLGVKKHTFVLAVSSLDPRKNFANLVKAYNKAALNDLRLVIVGGQNKVFADDELRNIIENNTNIKLTGYITDDELAVLYRAALVFVYPSLYEGFGIPPLEAMASNCPVIVSDTSSMPQVCGNAGLYIDPYDNEQIKDALIKITTDENLRKNMILAGASQVKKYSWQQCALQMIDTINALT